MSETNTNNPEDLNLNWQHPTLGEMDDDDPRIDRFCIDLVNQEIMEADDSWNGTDHVISANTESFLAGLGIDQQAAMDRAFADCAEANRLSEEGKSGTLEHQQASQACESVIDEANERSWNSAHRAATAEDVERAENATPRIDLEMGDMILDVKELKKRSSFNETIKGGGGGIRGSIETDESTQCELDALAAAESDVEIFVYPEYCYS